MRIGIRILFERGGPGKKKEQGIEIEKAQKKPAKKKKKGFGI